MAPLIETERLLLREFNTGDNDFILQLLNSEDWLQNIGDRNVKNGAGAKTYLVEGPLKSYQEYGFGLSAVVLRKELQPLGMCGLLKRSPTSAIEIGFAFLPQYFGKGYALEISKALMKHAKNELGIQEIIATTIPSNIPSIRLLGKIGMQFVHKVKSKNKETDLLLFSNCKPHDEQLEIDLLTLQFFGIFSNMNGRKPIVEHLRYLMTSTATLTKRAIGISENYSLDEFIRSRQTILMDGSLKNFSEEEISAETKIDGGHALRNCLYKKSGELNGAAFETKGVKTLNFERTPYGWRIAKAEWVDE